MGLVNSEVDICNMAMDQLRQDASISSIDSPQTPEEAVFARWFDITRRALLRRYVWNFSKTRTTIPRTGTPAFGYTDEYQLPNDFLRFNTIGDDVNDIPNLKYEIEGNALQINNDAADSVKLIYQKDVTSVAKMDPLFIQLFAMELALKVAYKFTQQNSVIKRIRADAADLHAAATGVDGQERPPRRIQNSNFNNARRSMSTRTVAGPTRYWDY